MTTFKFHTDPGHGWLEVTPDRLAMVGLGPEDFTRCSYLGDLGEMYLEEDCDAPKFIRAWTDKYGTWGNVTDVYSRGDCFVRRLPQNRAGAWKPFG